MKTSLTVGVVVSLLALSGPVRAQEADAAKVLEWQAVVAGQILAFRTHDAPGALHFAGAAFHQTFSDPRQFFLAIISSGYGPIMDSHAQSFGPYQVVADGLVLQDVKITANDQTVYDAIYQLGKEADGWRVLGVQLSKTPAVGI